MFPYEHHQLPSAFDDYFPTYLETIPTCISLDQKISTVKGSPAQIPRLFLLNVLALLYGTACLLIRDCYLVYTH